MSIGNGKRRPLVAYSISAPPNCFSTDMKRIVRGPTASSLTRSGWIRLSDQSALEIRATSDARRSRCLSVVLRDVEELPVRPLHLAADEVPRGVRTETSRLRLGRLPLLPPADMREQRPILPRRPCRGAAARDFGRRATFRNLRRSARPRREQIDVSRQRVTSPPATCRPRHEAGTRVPPRYGVTMPHRR